jgi:hypothetical protein
MLTCLTDVLFHADALQIAVNGNPKLEATMDEHIRSWIQLIDNKYISEGDKTTKFDLSRSIPFLNVDLMSHLCLGKSFGCIENDTDMYKFLYSIRTGMIAQQCMSILSEVTGFLHALAGNSFLRKFMTVFPAPCHEEGIGRVMRVSLATLAFHSEANIAIGNSLCSYEA